MNADFSAERSGRVIRCMRSIGDVTAGFLLALTFLLSAFAKSAAFGPMVSGLRLSPRSGRVCPGPGDRRACH